MPAHRPTSGGAARRRLRRALPVSRAAAGRGDVRRRGVAAVLAVGFRARRQRASRGDRQRDRVREGVAPGGRAHRHGPGAPRARAVTYRGRGPVGDHDVDRDPRPGWVRPRASRLALPQRVHRRRSACGLDPRDLGTALGGAAGGGRGERVERSRVADGLDARLGRPDGLCRPSGMVARRRGPGGFRGRVRRRDRRAAASVHRTPAPRRGLPGGGPRPARAAVAARVAARPLRCRHRVPAAPVRRSVLLLDLHALPIHSTTRRHRWWRRCPTRRTPAPPSA